MQIKLADNQQQWDSWLKTNSQHNLFTQSWAWGDVLISEGKNVERLAVVEGDDVLAQAQVVYTRIPFGGQYAFCPQGPVVENDKSEIINSKVYETITDYLKNKKCNFFRIEPNTLLHTPNSLLLKKTIDINPPATLILDLDKSQEEILAGMHQKTRYNVHLAEKKGLNIKNEKPARTTDIVQSGGNLEVFWDLMNQTGSRDKFSLHHKSHYEKVLQSPSVFQLTAYSNGKAIACAVFTQFGNTFTYLYGASDYAHRDLMAPYLLQWEGIKMGKNNGCRWYDFFGVAPRCHSEQSEESLKPDKRDPSGKPQDDSYMYDPKHQYAGVTRFKLGFGGTPQQSAGTFDVIIDNTKYKLYNILRKLRRLL